MSQINTNTIANELGTGGPDFVGMPSVGGDPVVESGSNTDGEWTRFADGTQICRSTGITFSDGAIVASGSLYRSSAITWNYPIAFIVPPSFWGGTDAGSQWVLSGEASPGSAPLYVWGPSSSAFSRVGYPNAYGRWK